LRYKKEFVDLRETAGLRDNRIPVQVDGSLE
jgi:hypothetical protein